MDKTIPIEIEGVIVIEENPLNKNEVGRELNSMADAFGKLLKQFISSSFNGLTNIATYDKYERRLELLAKAVQNELNTIKELKISDYPANKSVMVASLKLTEGYESDIAEIREIIAWLQKGQSLEDAKNELWAYNEERGWSIKLNEYTTVEEIINYFEDQIDYINEMIKKS